MEKINITDNNMLEAIDTLISNGDERFKSIICEVIDTQPQNIRNVRLGLQHFTAENIRRLCERYNVNPNYIFGFSNTFYLNKKVNKNVNKKMVKSA